MQFDRKKRIKLSENDQDANSYPFWINFYTTPPNYKVSLQEIEDMVSERLKILKVIDNLMKQISDAKTKPNQYYETLISQINNIKHNNDYKNFFVLGRDGTSPKSFEARKRDHISHFLLRIYYCKNEDLRQWFISREVELFKAKFINSSSEDLQSLAQCLSYYGFNYEIISTTNNPDNIDNNKVYWNEFRRTASNIAFKLNFEDAIDLIKTRQVYLYQGYAYVGSNVIMYFLCNLFRSNLSQELAKMYTNFDCFENKRLLVSLDSLHKFHIQSNPKKTKQNDDQNSKDRIDPEQIDQLCKELFPPCMRSIHETLRKEHHLKHYGRLHYGLFLKSLGLTLDDAVDFFRSELSINNPEKFQKEYSYTIRHIYGKEGKRVQLSAYSCQKIINGNAPGPNDTHGCPFRHYDINNLKALLIRHGINQENDLNEIIDLVKNDKNYNGACTKYFRIRYQRELPEEFKITHPNQFYRAAHNLLYSPMPILDKPINEGNDNVDENDKQKNNDQDEVVEKENIESNVDDKLIE